MIKHRCEATFRPTHGDKEIETYLLSHPCCDHRASYSSLGQHNTPCSGDSRALYDMLSRSTHSHLELNAFGLNLAL